LLSSRPAETPEEISTADHDNRFRKADFGRGKGLAHAVGGRNDVPVHQRYLQTPGVPSYKHRLMQVRQSGSDCGAIAAAADH